MNALAKSLELSSCAASFVRRSVSFRPPEGIDYTIGERHFRTNDRQHDAAPWRRTLPNGGWVSETLGTARTCRIAWGNEHLAHALRLRDFRRDSMLTAASADDQYVQRIVGDAAEDVQDTAVIDAP